MFRFAFTVWSVDKDGRRFPAISPIFLRMQTPLRDFTVPAQGFPGGLWPFCRKSLQDYTVNRFSQQGGSGASWQPLSDKPPGKGYASRKEKLYPGAQILQARGDMMASFFGGPNYVFQQTPLGMKYGSQDPAAGYHQRGHDKPTPLPQRQIWGDDMRTEVQPDIRRAVTRYVGAREREEGFRVAEGVYGPAERAAPAAGNLGAGPGVIPGAA